MTIRLYIIFSLFLFSIILPFTTNADISSGLVGHWTFDEGGGMTVGDSSGNNKVGTLIPVNNGPTWIVDSKIGSGALEFGGINKFVKIPTAPIVVAPYSVSFWFYPTTLSGIQGLLFYGLTNPGMGMSISNRIQIASYSAGTFRTFCNKIFSSADLNKWHHLTAVINSSVDASQWKCYINSVDIGVADSDNSGTYANPGNTDWTIGAYYNNSYWFNGKIDDVRVYNRALPVSDVTELYNYTGGASIPEPTTTPIPTPTSTPTPTPTPIPTPTPTLTPTPTPSITNEVSALSCQQSDVQFAINSVASGGIVNVPVGSCIWYSAITINKPLTIKGNNTTLTAGATLPNGFFYVTGFTSDVLMRITGFTLINRVADMEVQSNSIEIANNISLRNLRIDHNIFYYGYESIWVSGSFGVIDNNYFYNSRKAISFGGGSRAQADASWNSLTAGTADALFVESNNFITNASYPLGYTQEQIGTYNGGKLVVRYNNFNATNVSETLETYTPFMAHGSADGGCGGVGYWQSSSCQRRGQSVIEFYNNIQSGKRIDFMYISRGSVNIIHDNTITGIVTNNPRIMLVEEEYNSDNWAIPRVSWPAEDQVHNTFIWNNTYRGHDFNDGVYGSIETSPTNYVCTANKTPISCCTGSGIGTCGSNSTPTTNPFIRKDRDYFLHAPCGASDITDAYGNVCTHGKETFSGLNGASNTYPTDGTVYPTFGTMVFSSGGSNAYYPYVPYMYPHPLAAGITIPTDGLCSVSFNICTRGTFSDIADTNANYIWQCIGLNGGSTASCSLPRSTPTPTPTPSLPDTTAPTISITSPNNNTTISNTVTLSSVAQDPTVAGQTTSGILTVQFKLDNLNLGQPLTTAPYSGTWNTIGVTNGSHTLTAVATDVAGNTKTSNPITITISNTTPSTPTPTSTPTPANPSVPTPTPLNPTPTPSTPASGGGTTGGGGGGTTGAGSSPSSPGNSSSGGGSPLGTFTPTVPQKPLTGGGNCTQTPAYTRTLTLGSTGTDVKNLQIFLNSKGFMVSQTGPGSKGQETTYFGPATMKALAKFQQANNILPATGYLNTPTLTKVNSLSTTTPKCSDIPPLTTTSRLPPSYVFTTTLKQGMTSPSVKYLQIFLNDNGYTVSLTGPGSKGNESTYFGPATQRALIKYQEYYAKDILTPYGLTKGTGYFGPATMRRVNGGQR